MDPWACKEDAYVLESSSASRSASDDSAVTDVLCQEELQADEGLHSSRSSSLASLASRIAPVNNCGLNGHTTYSAPRLTEPFEEMLM